MSKGIGMLFTFVVGVATGVAATYKIAETKYRNIANEEINSVIERFSNREPLVVELTENTTDDQEEDQQKNEVTTDRFSTSKSSFVDYKSKITETGYDKVSMQNSKPKKSKKKPESKVDEDDNTEEV